MPALLIALALAAEAPSAPARPLWRAYAECAAAYEVNARIADPDRPPTMASMIDEVAQDYRRAAVDAYRSRLKASPEGAARAVGLEVRQAAGRLQPKPRVEVERIIDACPQLPESG